MAEPMKPTHLYKGKPVQFIERTWVDDHGQQHCTILMVNKFGKQQRQTVLEKNLTAMQADVKE